LYLGPVPWLALVFAMVISGSLGMGATAWLGTHIPKSWGRYGTLLVYPLGAAALWVLREAVASRFPYGGFSWGRFSFAHSDSPFSHLLAWVASAGLAFIAVAILVLFLQLLLQKQLAAWLKPLPVLTLVLLPLWPQWAPQIIGEVRIAAVQGDADASLNSTNPRGTILKNHYDATMAIINEKFDLLVWPENASDLDPLRNELAAATLDYLSETLNVPIVVGTITKSGDELFNSALLWESGKGAVDQYDKVHPVPFAEYMPNREFFMMLAPDLVSLVTRDYSFGERDPIFDIHDFHAGIAICYDIADDEAMRQMIFEGAQIILAPTNNADFGETDQNQQQLAIARVRGLESARSVVNISTVGTSAIIAPDGTLIDELVRYEPGAMIANVPLAEGVTPAVAMQWYFEAALAVLLALLFSVVIVISAQKKRA
ncbi:MAG: apolipoprotein N-acyltransferase, partial [Microbacteriaceae bacterium]